MECTFFSSFCSSGVSIASLFSPASPTFLPSPSPLSQSIHSPIFFSPMPRPYLSILSPSSFRRHFSSSSPVAHAGVTRFSVAGGRRRKVSGGSQLGHTHVCERTWWSRLVWFSKWTNIFEAFQSITPAIPLRHLIDAANAWGGIPRMKTIPERVTHSPSTRNTCRKCTTC